MDASGRGGGEGECSLGVALVVDEASSYVTLQIESGFDAFSDHAASRDESEKRRSEAASVKSVESEGVDSDHSSTLGSESNVQDEVATSPVVQTVEESTQPAFLRALSASLPLQRTNEELKDLTLEVLKQFELDRIEHCQLIERLDVCLNTLRKGKRQLMETLMDVRSSRGESSDRRAYCMMHQEQLLSKVIVGKQLLQCLRHHVSQRTGAETCFRDVTHRVIGSASRTEGTKIPAFTKKPLPNWLSENVPPTFMRPKSMPAKQTVYLHPLMDMAMRIEKKEGKSGDPSYHIQWVPKKSTAAAGTVPSEAERSASPVTVRSVSPRKIAVPTKPSDATPAVQQQPEPKQEKEKVPVERKKAEAWDVLLGMSKMGLESKEQKPTVVAQAHQQESIPVSTPPVTAKRDEAKPAPPVAPEPAGADESPASQMAFSPEAPKPSAFASQAPSSHPSSFFQAPIQTGHMQASSIAGGAAFGQPSFPRANFGISSVAPQLGSLSPPNSGIDGNSSQGGFERFAAIGGGFAAFASQGSFQGISGQSFGSGFAQQKGFSPSFAPSAGTALNNAASTTSIFGMQPVQDSSRMWEMRK